MKPFKLGFIVGRFQLLHKGHEQLIDLGLELCEKFVVLVGSSNESRTENNPFTFEERKEMIQKVYGDKVEVYPIINIGIGYVPEWGNYLLNTIKFYCGEYPDFVINGSEDGRSNWLSNEQRQHITELTVSRDKIKISATDIRKTLLEQGTMAFGDLSYKNGNDKPPVWTRTRTHFLNELFTREDIIKYYNILYDIKCRYKYLKK